MTTIQNEFRIALNDALEAETAIRSGVTRIKQVIQEVHDAFVARSKLLPSTGDVQSEEYEKDGINFARFSLNVKPVDGDEFIANFTTGELPAPAAAAH